MLQYAHTRKAHEIAQTKNKTRKRKWQIEVENSRKGCEYPNCAAQHAEH